MNNGHEISTDDVSIWIQDIQQFLAQRWRLLLAVGSTMILLGSLAIIFSTAFTFLSVVMLAGLLLSGGVLQLAQVSFAAPFKQYAMPLLVALAYIIGGIVMLINPLKGSMALTMLIAIIIAFVGILRISASLQMRGVPGWGWGLFSGVISLWLAGLIFSEWPESALWVVGLLLGIELVFQGWAFVMLALSVKPKATP